MKRSALLAAAAIAILPGCVTHQPLPARPTIEGKWQSVSYRDVYSAIDAMKRSLASAGEAAPSIYRVQVMGHDKIHAFYVDSQGARGALVVVRQKGTWDVSTEEVIVTSDTPPPG